MFGYVRIFCVLVHKNIGTSCVWSSWSLKLELKLELNCSSRRAEPHATTWPATCPLLTRHTLYLLDHTCWTILARPYLLLVGHAAPSAPALNSTNVNQNTHTKNKPDHNIPTPPHFEHTPHFHTHIYYYFNPHGNRQTDQRPSVSVRVQLRVRVCLRKLH